MHIVGNAALIFFAKDKVEVIGHQRERDQLDIFLLDNFFCHFWLNVEHSVSHKVGYCSSRIRERVFPLKMEKQKKETDTISIIAEYILFIISTIINMVIFSNTDDYFSH